MSSGKLRVFGVSNSAKLADFRVDIRVRKEDSGPEGMEGCSETTGRFFLFLKDMSYQR